MDVILAVPLTEVTGIYRDIETFEDLDKMLLDQIEHFFEHYKDLEPNKWVRTGDWEGLDAARREIIESVARYEAAPEKPAF